MVGFLPLRVCKSCCTKIKNWCLNQNFDDVIASICMAACSFVTIIFFLILLSWSYVVKFHSIDYDLINSSLPRPLFNQTIPDLYTELGKSVAIYGTKKTGKSTFGKVLAMHLYDTERPLIYLHIKKMNVDPCIELAMAAGLYPKPTDLIHHIDPFTLSHTKDCKVDDILEEIATAALSKGVTARVIIDPLERFSQQQIESICHYARYSSDVINFVLISTATSQGKTTGMKHCHDHVFKHSYFGDISKDESLSYLRTQCGIDDYDACVAHDIIGGDLGFLHQVCNGEAIDEIITDIWAEYRTDILERAHTLQPVVKKLLNGKQSMKEFTPTEITTIKEYNKFISQDIKRDEVMFAKRIYFHLFNDLLGNKSFFDTDYNGIKTKCQNIKKTKK